jgi:hypothetical protein
MSNFKCEAVHSQPSFSLSVASPMLWLATGSEVVSYYQGITVCTGRRVSMWYLMMSCTMMLRHEVTHLLAHNGVCCFLQLK